MPIWDVKRYYYIGYGEYVNDPKERLFSFDKVKIYDYSKDYPHNLTKEEQELFKKYAKHLKCTRAPEKFRRFLSFKKIKNTNDIFDVLEDPVDEEKNEILVEFGKNFFSFDKKLIYNFWPERSDEYTQLTEEQRRLMYKYISPFEEDREKYK